MTYRTTLPQQIVGDLGTIKVDRTTPISPTKDTIASEENKKVECIVELFERAGLSNGTTSGSFESRIYDLETSVTGTINPATTVMGEVTFGLSPVVGTGSLYARHDHTHGTPPAPGGSTPASTVMGEITYGITPVVGTGSDYARHDHTHGTPPAINPASLVVGETTYGLSPAVGDSVAYARENHCHGSPPTAPPVSGTAVISEQTYGQTPSPGISSSYAKEDHTHGTPSKYYPAFTELTDGPGTYSGAKGQIPVVNLAETGLEWTSGTTDFIDLQDVPASYAGAANMLVAVKADEKALEFISSSAGAVAFLDLTDVPASYAGAQGMIPAVNAGENALEFISMSAGATPAASVVSETTYGLSPAVGTGSDFARNDHTHGTPASDAISPATTIMGEVTYGISPVVGTGSLYARHDHTHGTPAVPAFTSLSDVPASYSGKSGMVVAVSSSEAGLAFISSSAGGAKNATIPFAHRGTAGGWSVYQIASTNNNYGIAAGGTAGITLNTLFGLPFSVPGGGVIDKIKIYYGATAAWSDVGVYKATSTSNLYPNNLIADCGAKNTSAGGFFEWTGLSITITSDELYWFAMLGNASTATIAVFAPWSSPVLGIIGNSVAVNAPSYTWCSVAQAYGALPATFTAGATLLTSDFPLIYYHLSS